MVDDIGLQAMLFFGVPFESMSIKSVQPIVGAKPGEAPAILMDALYVSVGKTIFNAKVLDDQSMVLCVERAGVQQE